jgi:tRNA A-37 threonylcarbamoyl transferase component Bud32
MRPFWSAAKSSFQFENASRNEEHYLTSTECFARAPLAFRLRIRSNGHYSNSRISCHEGPMPASESPSSKNHSSPARERMDSPSSANPKSTNSESGPTVGPNEPWLPTGGLAVAVGATLAGYKLVEKLGEGGMGAVFIAEDIALRRRVALKTMKPELAARELSKQRFFREARAAARIEHDNIVPIYQVGEENGVPFLAMALLKGESLGDFLKKTPRPDLDFLLKAGQDTAEGLAAAHEQGLIHRDIKPDNIWIEPLPKNAGVRAKILDFGLARPQSEDESLLTQEGAILGTPAYMAPEQARGEAVDHRADLFSLGCVLYQMATGRRPFTGASVVAVLTAIATETPPGPMTLNPTLPPILADLIMRLLEKDAARRIQSANEVVEALRSLQPKSTVVVIATTRAAPETSPWADIDADDRMNAGPPREASSVGRFKKPLLVGSALFGLIALIAVIVVIIYDKDGKKIAELEVPPGGSVEIKTKTADPGKKAVDGPSGSRIETKTKPDDLSKKNDAPMKKKVDNAAGKAPDLSKAKLLFKDDFDDPKSGWAVQKGKYFKLGYDKSKYFINLNADAERNSHCPGGPFADFACQVRGRLTEAVDGGWALEIQDDKHTMTISLTRKQELVVKTEDAEKQRTFLGPVQHPAIRPINEQNQMLLVVRGQRATVYINDVAVTEPFSTEYVKMPVTITMDAIASPTETTRAEFENFRVWSIAGLPDGPALP